MEYFLRQIEPGNPNPLIIKLNSNSIFVGRDTYPVLAKYPNVLPQHVQFLKHTGKWFVKCMQNAEKIYVNGSRLIIHRLEEIQIGDHIEFGDTVNHKRFICCLSVKAIDKGPEIEVIDISTDDSPITEKGGANDDQTVKAESSGNGISIIKCEEGKITAKENEHLVSSEMKFEYNCSPTVKSEPFDLNPVKSELDYNYPPTVKSELVNDSQPFIKSELVDKRFQIAESELGYSCPPTVKSEPVNDSPPFIKSESMDERSPDAKSELRYSCPPTVKSEPVNDSPPFIKSEPMDKEYPVVESKIDYSCPHTVRNDYVPFVKRECGESNLPVIQKESLNNRHSLFKTEDMNTNSPFINDKHKLINPSLMKSQETDTNSPIKKSESIDISSPFTKTESMNINNQFTKTELINAVFSPASLSVKSDLIDNLNKISNSSDFVPPTAQMNLNFLKQATTSSVDEKLTLEQFHPASSSSSSVNNFDINKKFASLMSDVANSNSLSTEKSVTNFKDLLSTSSNQNIFVNATSDANKSCGINSGYSEIEDVITISDDEAYLDYNSCKIIKQEYPDDDFNIKYCGNSNSNATEIYNEKDLDLHSLLFGDDSTLSSISDSIKEHEESAKKMLDGDSEIDHKNTSITEAISKDDLKADVVRRLSNSSVSSHEDIIIPFAKKKQSDPSNNGNRNSENDTEMTVASSKKENQGIASIKRPYSTFKKQSLKKTLLTEPKQLTNFRKKRCKQEEHGKDSQQIKKKIRKKSKDGSVLSSQKVLEKSKNSSVFSTQNVPESSSKGKCALPKTHMMISNKNFQPAKRNIGKNTQKSSKVTNGVVLTKKLEFKIPKINKDSFSDVKSNIETTAHQAEGSTLDKKAPSIARKPNKWASRSKFLITDFTTEKRMPPKKISAVLKQNVRNEKVTLSTNSSSSIDGEINEIGKETASVMSTSNVTADFQNSSIPVINTPRINTNPQNFSIPVIINSNRRTDRKSLNDDSNLLKIPAGVSRSVSLNQVEQELMNKSQAVHSFDKNKTQIVSGDNLHQSKEQNFVLKQQFPSSIADTSTKNTNSTEWQLFFKDIELNSKSDTIHTFDKGKTPGTSKNYFQSSTDQTIVSKLSLGVTSASYNERSDLLNKNVQVFSTHHHKKNSDVKNLIIKTIVEWKELWFKEYEKINKPHESLTNGVLDLPLYFSSLEHYISSFISMLLLEIWDHLYIAYKPIQEDERKVTNKFYFIVTAVEMKYEVAEYHCEALINLLSFEPKDGNLVVMFVKNKKDSENINPIFGFIKSYEIQSNNNINPELLNIDQSWAKEAKLYRFSVLVKIRPQLSPILNTIMKGNGLCCISKYFKLVEAAQNLEYSPLCQSILIPDSDIIFSNYPEVPSTSTFSKTQMSIIQGISSEVEKHTSDPKLFLIQGAPGTGKTRVILGLLENLISSCLSKQKILIVAPTSQAIDEIGSRLIEMNKRLQSWRPHEGIRFVRVNLQEKTSEKMKPFSLDEIYVEYKIKGKMEKLKNISMQIQVLLKSNDPLDQDDMKSLIEQQKDLRSQIEFTQSDKKTRLDYYHYLLQESQVILTTVSCCSSQLLQDFCKQNWNLVFSCCVIDEVTQCTELELLQVISLGINKLILVGNQYGLPPVLLSKTAKNLGYERSTFERFLQYFSHTKQENPAIELLIQYRMHSEICYFPSHYFYGNRLITADGIDSRYEHFLEVNANKKLAPYTVFHLLRGSNMKLYTDAIIKLCIQSVTLKPGFSIGIIVPSKDLLEFFKNWITVLRASNSNYEVIEVGTVEDFQGQEKDVVFLCCYKVGDSNSFLSNSRKLNVALTRARQCLILCVFLPKQNMEQDWVNLITEAQNRKCFYFIKTKRAMSLILK